MYIGHEIIIPSIGNSGYPVNSSHSTTGIQSCAYNYVYWHSHFCVKNPWHGIYSIQIERWGTGLPEWLNKEAKHYQQLLPREQRKQNTKQRKQRAMYGVWLIYSPILATLVGQPTNKMKVECRKDE